MLKNCNVIVQVCGTWVCNDRPSLGEERRLQLRCGTPRAPFRKKACRHVPTPGPGESGHMGSPTANHQRRPGVAGRSRPGRQLPIRQLRQGGHHRLDVCATWGLIPSVHGGSGPSIEARVQRHRCQRASSLSRGQSRVSSPQPSCIQRPAHTIPARLVVHQHWLRLRTSSRSRHRHSATVCVHPVVRLRQVHPPIVGFVSASQHLRPSQDFRRAEATSLVQVPRLEGCHEERSRGRETRGTARAKGVFHSLDMMMITMMRIMTIGPPTHNALLWRRSNHIQSLAKPITFLIDLISLLLLVA